jgi:hypothetical protein
MVSCKSKESQPVDSNILLKGREVVTPFEGDDFQQQFKIEQKAEVVVEIEVLSGPPVDFLVCDEREREKLARESIILETCKGYVGIKKEVMQKISLPAGHYFLWVTNNRHTEELSDPKAKSSNFKYSISTPRL